VEEVISTRVVLHADDTVDLTSGRVKVGLTTALEGADPINERLRTLVVDPINALPPEERTVGETVYSGEEVARAIPDQEAFFREIESMQEATFFELNPKGQLLMMDGRKEAYGLNEDFHKAKIRQTRLVYRGEDGAVRVMEGKDCLQIKGAGSDVTLCQSEAAEGIPSKSILMRKGLPTLKLVKTGRHYVHEGEYARMNKKGLFDRTNRTWVEGNACDQWHARYAYWDAAQEKICSSEDSSLQALPQLGSHGVLTVNLTCET
jgi:hypothetical protein